MTKLIYSLRCLAEGSGADFFGTADLTTLNGGSVQHSERTGCLNGAVSLGISLNSDIVNQLRNHREHTAAVAYRRHWSDTNRKLDRLADLIAIEIQRAGFRSSAIPASEITDSENLRGALSHKMCANLAGLGWIGKSALLITPQSGPRVRWVTVLTDAPIEVPGNFITDGCGDCNLCVEICPASAFTGRLFDPVEEREMRFSAKKCKNYHQEMAADAIRPLCGLCVYVCPFGRERESSPGPHFSHPFVVNRT